MTSRSTPRDGWTAVPNPSKAAPGAEPAAVAPAAPEAAAVRRAPLQSKKTLVGLPAAAFFGQLPGASAPAAGGARPEAAAPRPTRERDATEEVSLSDMSLSSLGPANFEATQDVSLDELKLASHRADVAARPGEPELPDAAAAPAQEPSVRTRTLSTLPAPAARSKRWLWAVAALPLVLATGWFALDKSRASEAGKSAPPAVPAVAPASAPPSPEAVLAAHVADDAPPAAADQPAGQVAADDGAQAIRKRADALILQASALRKRRKLGPARSKYQAALTLVPGDPGALRGLVQIALQQRDGNQAVQRARELVESAPGELSYLVLLGDAYKAAGKPKDAREAWQTAARRGNTQARKRLK